MSIQFVTSTSDFETYLSSNKFLVANFTASWCGPCQAIKPRIDEIYPKYPGVEIVRVDLDSQRELATRYTISAVPTFVFFQDKQEVSRVRGANINSVIENLEKLNNQAIGQGVTRAGAEPVEVTGLAKEVAEFIPKGFSILNSSIEFGKFEALNSLCLYQNSQVQDIVKLDSEISGVWSDADSQLNLFVPLLNICKVYSILFKFKPKAEASLQVDEEDFQSETQTPNIIKIWPNVQSILSFDEASSSSNPAHLEKVSEDVTDSWYEIKLKFVRFQNVQNLNIFFDGKDEDFHTTIEKIVIIGTSGDSLNQGTVQSLGEE
ncbi:Thioredoxin-like protein 1 [Spathaspora sp. JA1]|nr:Thioredoxin-like protein 1 [Spathaspora sp. JA1]